MEAARAVSGIKSVRSKIEISSGVSDGFLLFTTKLGMISDARINGFGIKVSVEDGIIILRGTVDDEHTRQIAINKAKGLAGAKGVISYLEVSEKISLDEPLIDDKVIITQIEDLLKTDKTLLLYNIKATSVNGIVTLSGTVDSRDTVLLAVEKVGAISGVRAVKSELEIK
jgi:hyperosmotically inducible protein